MSQKSTARTGSEGDVKEAPNINARSGDSSCKSKRDLLGGPFGDSPYDQAQDAYQDYLLVMFHNNEDSAGTSESSQADGDLYNMRYNYTEQLNLVRKKLNLMELSEDVHQRCTITEIVEDEPGTSNQNASVPKPNSLPHQRPVSSDGIFSNSNRSKCFQLTTIHPFSLNYNLDSKSSSNVLEQDYSPPTKRVCQRLKTPRFISVSEGDVPYNTTKVEVHETPVKEEEKEEIFVSQVVKDFTETRQTQCNEEEFDNLNFLEQGSSIIATPSQSTDDKLSILNLSFETGSDSEYSSKKSQPLFPNVIIETKEDREKQESSLSPRSSRKYTNTSSSRNLLSLNSVRGSSDEEEFYTVRVTKTTIAAGDEKKKSKKGRQIPLKKMTMFEEMTRLRSGTNESVVENRGQGDGEQTGDASYDIRNLDKYIAKLSYNAKLDELTKNSYGDGKPKLDRYIRQYVQYKTDMEKLTTAKNYKNTIIGQRLVNIQNRIMDSPDKLYQSENSLVSDEEKQRKYSSSPGDSSDSGGQKTFWERICFCLCPARDFND